MLSHLKQTPGFLAWPISLGCLFVTALSAQLPASALPSSFRVAQEIIEGLPPPPATVTPNVVPQPVESEPPSRPTNPIQPPERDRLPQETREGKERFFLVLINGNSPLLLEQVRRVESGAFLQSREGQQIIQAGLFRQRESAKQQVAALEQQGILAEIIAVEVPVAVSAPAATATGAVETGAANTGTANTGAANTGTANTGTANTGATREVSFSDLVPVTNSNSDPAQEVVFGQSSGFSVAEPLNEGAIAASTGEFSSNSRYYVVIPGRAAEIGGIIDRTTQLSLDLIGDVEQAIQERDTPRGIHVLVGPFVDRQTAFRWDRYFRTFGLVDSRVYYRR